MNTLAIKLALLLMTLFLFSCASHNPTKATPETTFLNEYPTKDRVEFAIQCIDLNGGLSYENLYNCTCSIDKIASQMRFDDYTEAMTFTFLRRTPGENGGVFRDPPKAKQLRKQLKDAKAYAEQACFSQ